MLLGRSHFDPGDMANEEWLVGARFGFERYQECEWGQTFRSGLAVRIRRIDGHAVDTTVPIVAYTTFYAIAEALGTDLPLKPELDAETGRMSF